jgi:phosphatidylglycerol:prolipoprotein diacylglycerol transferase
MCPYFNIFGLNISSYAFFLCLSFIAGSIFFLLINILLYKNNVIRSFLGLGIIGILFCASMKLTNFIEYQDPDSLLHLFIGVDGMGMFYVAPLVIFLLHKVLKESYQKAVNTTILTIVLAFSFSNLGCLFGGCCYGVESSFGIIYPGETVTRFPTPLIGSITFFVLFSLLFIFLLKKPNTYYPGLIGILSYCILRFVIEISRYDNSRYGGIFDIYQIHCLVCIFVALVLFVFYEKVYLPKNHLLKEN